MLENVKIQIFLPSAFTGGYPYIIHNAKKYCLDSKTSSKLLKNIKKNQTKYITINGRINKNQYGYGPNTLKPKNTILITHIRN